MQTLPNNSAPQQTDESTLSRGEFIRSLGMSSAALMAFYCMGTLSSCKGSSSDPAPVVTPGAGTGVTGNASTSAGAINFTLDLTNTNLADLKTAGSYKSVGDIIVFNASGTYKALGRICTHQGGNLSYNPAGNDLICDLHSSHYNTDGSPKSQPIGGGTITAVKAYSATLSGNSLTVKA